MRTPVKAFLGAAIFDGETLHAGKVLVVDSQGTPAITEDAPTGCPCDVLDGGILTPGFVDLQVNGGGGLMFNDAPEVATLERMAEAHRQTGSAALLPTLITDTPEHTAAAIDAVEQAIAEDVPGIVGLHLEGPHLSVARKGAHDPNLIRRMDDDDLATITRAAERIANVMVTIAPESTTPAQIRRLSDAGIVVSLGHTDADYATCMEAFDAGARCSTHLFNAMSQMGNREPGLVGATLARDDVHAGLIADGIHVHPATMRNALAAKASPEKVFLVTDAMATAGSDITTFQLNGRDILRQGGRLTLQDGTLAGADLDFPRALAVLTGSVGENLETALRRATSAPVILLRDKRGLGSLAGGLQGMIHLQGSEFRVSRLSV